MEVFLWDENRFVFLYITREKDKVLVTLLSQTAAVVGLRDAVDDLCLVFHLVTIIYLVICESDINLVVLDHSKSHLAVVFNYLVRQLGDLRKTWTCVSLLVAAGCRSVIFSEAKRRIGVGLQQHHMEYALQTVHIVQKTLSKKRFRYVPNS